MLGINAPKTIVRGEYAKAVRKAVRDSIEAIKNGSAPTVAKKSKYNFEWKI